MAKQLSNSVAIITKSGLTQVPLPAASCTSLHEMNKHFSLLNLPHMVVVQRMKEEYNVEYKSKKCLILMLPHYKE